MFSGKHSRTLGQDSISRPNECPDESANHYATKRQVFTFEEEHAPADYILKCSKMFHGLSVKQTRKLAWEYAKPNLKTYPNTWDVNREAGQEWFYGLMKRDPGLSLRMPETTSIARATGFNRQSVQLFFGQYCDIASRPAFKLEPHCIRNLDETGVKTVADMTRVVSQKGLKQVRQISSAERSGDHVLLY